VASPACAQAHAPPHSSLPSPLSLSRTYAQTCQWEPMSGCWRHLRKSGGEERGGRGVRASDITRACAQAHAPPHSPPLSSLPIPVLPHTCAHTCIWEPMSGDWRHLRKSGWEERVPVASPRFPCRQPPSARELFVWVREPELF